MIVVDELQTYDRIKSAAKRFGTCWCHLTVMPTTPEQALTEADIVELHAFAARLGLRRTYFQDHPQLAFRHYDLVPSKRHLAVALGAKEVASRDWAQSLPMNKQYASATQVVPEQMRLLPSEEGIS